MKKIAAIITLCLCSSLLLAVGGCGGDSAGDEVKAEEIYARDDIAVYDDEQVTSTNLNPIGVGDVPNTLSTNYLLYGYNVIDYGYIDSQNINKRYAILDQTKLLNSDYAKVDATRSDITYLTSNSASNLLEKFNVSTAVKYKNALFSGGIKADYGLSKELDENQKLIKYIGFYRVYEQYLVANNTRIKALLMDQFKQDLANPGIGSDERMASGKTRSEEVIDALFKNYGTHLIQQYYLGGRFDLNFNYTSSASLSEQDIKTSVEAAYAGFSGTASAESKERAKKVTEHSNLTFKSVGGTLITGSTAAVVSTQFPAWLDSLSAKNDICEIGSFDSAMLPIWELTDNDTVKKRLKDRFDVLLEQAANALKQLDPKPQYITDIIVAADRNSDTALAKIPSGYTKVLLNPGTDSTEIVEANKGAGGDFIYIAYKMSTDKSQAIYDIYVDYGQYIGDFSRNGHDYKKINVDLNQRAGGNYIWLFYSKAKSPDTKFIKEIRGTYGGDYALPAGGWQWAQNSVEMVDLNRGCGRRTPYIYLAFRSGS